MLAGGPPDEVQLAGVAAPGQDLRAGWLELLQVPQVLAWTRDERAEALSAGHVPAERTGRLQGVAHPHMVPNDRTADPGNFRLSATPEAARVQHHAGYRAAAVRHAAQRATRRSVPRLPAGAP